MSEQVDEKRKGTTEKKEEEGTGQVGQIDQSVPKMSGDRGRRVGRRPGRRASKMDVRAKLERSRQSARECRARKKLRYQYLEDLVANREKAVFALRDELEMYKRLCAEVDEGKQTEELKRKLEMTITGEAVRGEEEASTSTATE